MNFFRKTLIVSFLLGTSVLTHAQTETLKYCGQVEALRTLYTKYPALKTTEENHRLSTSSSPLAQKTASVSYIIPVVFHIMHTYGAENISDAQVIDAVRILNEDYQLKNADTSVIVASFKNLKADVGFEFRLAKLDPNGNCTNGILHVETPLTNIGNDDVKYDQWDPSKYLNVWVVKKISSGAAGYAYYPSSADAFPAIDGIIILSDYVGSIGTGVYGKARALTHEIGHYLDLAHVWGSTNNPGVACGDDGISDTPDTEGWTTCNLSGSVCNPGVIENVQNYMEYAYCSKMFTLGQKQVMVDALNSTIANRNNLWSPSNLLATGTDNTSFLGSVVCKPTADFFVNYKSICEGASVTYKDVSYNATTVSRKWEFQGGTPATSTFSSQAVTYSVAGTYFVKLRVTNAQGSDSLIRTSYISVKSLNSPNPSYFSEGFETITVPNADWSVNSGADNVTWTITPVGATGSQSVRIRNSAAINGDVDELISPSLNMDPTQSTNLSFKVAFAQKNTSNTDKLVVYVSNDCGRTWIQRYSKQGAALATITATLNSSFTPNTTQWRSETVTLPYVYVGHNTLIKFEFTSGGGNNIYLDDINIASTVGVNELDVTQPITMQIMPNPFDDFTTVSIHSKIDETVSAQLVDVIGKTVLSLPNIQLSNGGSSFTIPKNNLSEGLYFLTVSGSTYKNTQKIIIK